MKNIFFILMILISCGVQSQEKYVEEKKEAFKLLAKLDSLYPKKDKKLNSLFTNNVQCSICEIENRYDNQYIIENKKFVQNNLQEVIKLLDYKLLKKSNSTFTKQGTNFILSYSTTDPHKKAEFEGASTLITLKKENGRLKIYSIETIP
ncbi:hypothetical protein [Chryseobacterium sp. MEBOG07]|uniref:hypothetical protein n=1 Tax=Chryseobacterium sp. MEBOG07 TaxID=2879939 RepID=UPI001F18ACDF|nr:hypothetical protein [Chryseobacterium sp. MEBOG07]UKB77932.1 hypothetical protein LF886_15730 [Chryseobacterium sp. MEBOG07]